MRSVVTGSTGFIGGHLVERLAGRGDEVVCLVRTASRLDGLRRMRPAPRLVDRADADAVAGAVAGADAVFNLAGVTRARSAQDYERANVEATRDLLASVARAQRPPRFVHVSSQAACGPSLNGEPVTEDTPPHPISGYGRSKLAAEEAVLACGGRVPVTIVRPPSVYGPGDRDFLPVFRMAERWRAIASVGPGRTRVSLIYVSDLVDALLLAAGAGVAAGRTYFVGGTTCTLAEFEAQVCAALGAPARRLRLPAAAARASAAVADALARLRGKPSLFCADRVRELLAAGWVCSWERAERELGYRAAVPLRDGVRRTAEWYALNGWLRHANRRKRNRPGLATGSLSAST